MKSKEILVKLSEKRASFYAENLKPEASKDVLQTIVKEMRDLELDYQDATRSEAEDPEVRERQGLRKNVKFREYVVAAAERRELTGEAAEYNAAINLKRGEFPLELLAPEKRTVTGIDSQAVQEPWLDRLLDVTAAQRLGIMFTEVGSGVHSYPYTNAGATGAQRGKEEDATVTAWTVNVKTLKPARNAVHLIYNITDSSRLPELDQALMRDARMGLTEAIDRAVFLGDSGATGTDSDIVGINTAASVTEKAIPQASKIKGPETLAAFVELVDGQHAESNGALNVVASEGSHALWYSTVFNSTADNETLAGFLQKAGVTWTVRGGIDTATTANKWGAFVGLSRGMAGAAAAPVWSGAELIIDPYSQAKGGKVLMTVNFIWNFQLVRPSNFARIKYS